MIKPLYIIIAAILILGIIGGIYIASGSSAPVVASGDTVSVYYTGTLTNGTQFDSNVGKQPLQFTVGSGQLIAGFDQAVVGMKLNETKTVTIPSDQAYGPVRQNLVISLPRKDFGNQTINVGMIITETSPQTGQQIRGIVKALNATNVTVDFNSPLAGQTLIFKITVAQIQKPH